MVPPRHLFRPALALVLAGLLGACAGDLRRSEAVAALDAGRYEEGLASLQEVARERPGDTRLRIELRRREEVALVRLLSAAQSALAAGRLDEAQVQFERVRALQPANPRASAGLEAIAAERRHAETLRKAGAAMESGDSVDAQAMARAVLQENPNQREARALLRQIDEQRVRESLAGPVLKARQNRPVTLEFRDASLRSAILALSRSTGINFVFDKDVRSDAKTTIYANQVSVEDALDLLLMTNQLERKIVAENTILIYPNTQQKLRDYQELVIRNFYLENADAKQTLNLVKTMLKTKDVFIDEKLNLLVMRDTPDAIRLAEKLIAAHDLAEPEVMLEVEVIEITHSKLSELGVKWSDQLGFGVVDITGAPFLVSDLRGINSNRISMTSPFATLNAKATDGDSNILASPRIRVKNREKARIQIGDRVPVVSGQTTVTTGNVLNSETVTYLDVGLKLEVEPNVHLDDDVDIRIALEVSTLGEKTSTSNGTVAYRVGTRNANTSLRLKDGETQVLMGLIRDDERRSANRVPGIGELPVLSHLFGSHQSENQKTEIVLAITPRLVRNLRRVEAQVAELWSGTESKMRSTPLFARTQPTTNAPAGKAPAAPSGDAAPALPAGPVPAPGAGAGAAPLGMQLSWTGPAQVRVGEEVTLVLRARAPQPVAGASLQIQFDATQLEFLRFAEGSFMKQGARPAAVNHRIDPASGLLTVRLARVGEGVTGEGDLLAVTFRVREAGSLVEVQATTVSSVGPGNRLLAAVP
ncbi:MAG: secretin and TonB N-terminal domain-containing protein, partial [Rhizobacter sp.]|nr:secretin and TonB N-terminal domain-containing protein [Rhizobacter sp.]